MSDLNELFAELKNEISDRRVENSFYTAEAIDEAFYKLDALINNGEFARAEQDAYIG